MVTPYYIPVIGGTESFIQSTSAKLNELGVSTDVLTFNLDSCGYPVWKTEYDVVDKSRVLRVGCHSSLRLTKLMQVSIVPNRFQDLMKEYDVIHFHNETDLSLPVFSYFVTKPKLMHCHCLDVSYGFYKKNPVSRTIFKRISDVHVAVSDSIQNLLIDLGIDKNNIRVVHNCVDTEKFRPSVKKKADNLVLFAGRLHPNKGLHILLRSLQFLKMPIELAVVGSQRARFYCSDYHSEILELVDAINKTGFHKVNLLGLQTQQELISLYQRATIFVCPSISEPFGIVNLEAMSCETPVVASNVGGIPEVVKHNTNGLLVPPGKPEELAKAIELLLEDKSLRDNFGREGRKWVVSYFSSEAVASRLRDLYVELVESYLGMA